jgi:hypothetical protein
MADADEVVDLVSSDPDEEAAAEDEESDDSGGDFASGSDEDGVHSDDDGGDMDVVQDVRAGSSHERRKPPYRIIDADALKKVQVRSWVVVVVCVRAGGSWSSSNCTA